jgi:hypothetical protein
MIREAPDWQRSKAMIAIPPALSLEMMKVGFEEA